jgi:hypothetical protein
MNLELLIEALFMTRQGARGHRLDVIRVDDGDAVVYRDTHASKGSGVRIVARRIHTGETVMWMRRCKGSLGRILRS